MIDGRVVRLVLLVILGLITILAVPVLSAPRLLETTPDIAGVETRHALSLQQGIDFYEAEQFSAAVAVWRQAAAGFAAEGDNLGLALVQSNLSLAYQHLGYSQEAEKAIAQCFDLLDHQHSAANIQTYLEVYAKALNTKGRWQWARGELEAAVETWKQAAANYAQAGNEKGVVGSLINQAKALQGLGVNGQAKEILERVAEVLEQSSDARLKTAGLNSLGKVYRQVGSLKRSQEFLEESLAVAEGFSLTKAKALALLELGNTEQAWGKRAMAIGKEKEAQEYYQTALNYYQQAATVSDLPILPLQAKLNQLSLLVETKNLSDIPPLLPEIKSAITFLPPSRATVYAQLNFARSLTYLRIRDKSCLVSTHLKMDMGMRDALDAEKGILIDGGEFFFMGTASCLGGLPSALEGESFIEVPSWEEVARIIATALEQANSLQDYRAQSYALGQLGGLYELTGQLVEAQMLTQQALKALISSQELQSPDIRYLWEWQLGRLSKQQGDIQGAVAQYTRAIKTLTSVRHDLITSNDVQFSFQENVEPIYRQLVDLLLQSEPKEEDLNQAREVIEELQLAELEDYLRCSLLNDKAVKIDQIVNQTNTTAAVIYPIILNDRLEIILKLPQQRLKHYQTSLSQQEFNYTIAQLRENLQFIHTLKQVQGLSQQLYGWLIQPIESELDKTNTKTLVFVLDGDLRNIPMALLYDGQQYLLEKYAIALTTGLELLDPKPLERQNLRVLTAGLTEARHGYSPLAYVDDELEQIESQVSGELLINQEFTSTELQAQIASQPFSVVHLATHGKFSSQPEETFVLAWDKPISMDELNSILRSRGENLSEAIELLVLSACQTAAGDKRAALGLAGVAVRAGARSTIASLWNADDESTAALMSQFYRELLNNQITKAEALRLAQLHLLREGYQHPRFWAPYVLIGNWL